MARAVLLVILVRVLCLVVDLRREILPLCPGRGIGYVMRMQPVAWPEPDPQVAAAIAAMYGSRKTERPLAVLIRDRLGEWLRDED
jgi:hypothetical protein